MRGVYEIRSPDGRCYIGGSANVRSRKAHHFWQLRSGGHSNRPLQQAWDQIGGDGFTFVVLEEVPDADDLRAAEQRWIDSRPRGQLFNVHPVAGSPKGFKSSDATRAKVSAALRRRYADPKERARQSAAQKGKTAGEKHYGAKLTDAAVYEIRRLLAAGRTQLKVAAMFGITQQGVGSIAKRKTWKHLPDAEQSK